MKCWCPVLFSVFTLGGLIWKEKEETVMWCFVSEPEAVWSSTPPCWWHGCRYQIRGRFARTVVPLCYYTVHPVCVHVCVWHLPVSPTGSSASPGRWVRKRFAVSFGKRWKSGVTSRRSPSRRSTVGRPTSASTSRGGRHWDAGRKKQIYKYEIVSKDLIDEIYLRKQWVCTEKGMWLVL